jgi:hypothetical protein
VILDCVVENWTIVASGNSENNSSDNKEKPGDCEWQQQKIRCNMLRCESEDDECVRRNVEVVRRRRDAFTPTNRDKENH